MTERLAELNAIISNAKAGYERIESNLTELSNAYVCRMDENIRQDLKRRGKSSLFIPTVPSVALKIYTSIVTTYFTNPNLARLSPDNPNDADTARAAEAIQETLRYYERHKILNLFPVISKEILNACVYLLCAVKVYWDGNAPRVDGIKLRDLWFDPSASDMRDMQYLVHRMFIPRHRLNGLKKMSSFNMDFDISEISSSTNFGGCNKSQPEKYQLIEVFDIYEREDGYWQLSTVIGDNVARNRYRLKDGLPIFIGRLIPQLILPNEYDSVEIYGASPIEYLLPLQAEMNQLRNQQLDAVKLQLEPQKIIALGSGINPFTAGTSKVIRANDINGIRELRSPDIGQSQQSVEQLQLEIQDISAVTPYNTGTSGDIANRTATGISILTQEANQRLNVYTHSFNETLMESMMAHLAKLIWRYADDRHFKGVNLSRDTDPELFVHINTGIGATSPIMRCQELQQAFTLLMQTGQEKGALKIAGQILEVLGVKNIEEYITDEQRVEHAAAVF